MTEKLSSRVERIDRVREELISVGNPASLVNRLADALLALRNGDEAFHVDRRQFFVVHPEFSDTLQVHVRHRDEGWQMFCDPDKLVSVEYLKARGL